MGSYFEWRKIVTSDNMENLGNFGVLPDAMVELARGPKQA